MTEDDQIRIMIKNTRSFREVISLRDRVWSLSGKIDLNDFLDLRDKVESKVKEFDNPLFGDLNLKVVLHNGDMKRIDPRELSIIMGKGVKLSEYIFDTYPDALDYRIEPLTYEDPFTKFGNAPSPEKIRIREIPGLKTGLIKEKIERIVRLAMKLAEMLFDNYAKLFPSIAEDLRLIKERIEELFEKISYSYY